VLVFGASGFVGAALVSAAESAGLAVLGGRAPRLATTAASAAELAAAARNHEALDGLAAAMAGHEIVINAAGLATPGASDSDGLRGANALLPAVLAGAAARSGVRRLVHLSSAAVQGNRPVLDESDDVSPFSPYSHSKALGEAALRLTAEAAAGPTVVTVRATSVQGPGRRTTASLVRFARSPLASVAAPGTAPSPVASVDALAEFVLAVALHEADPPPVVLQPWEGLTVRSVLESAGGRPLALPGPLCRAAVGAGYAVSAVLGGRLHGAVRRVEVSWFGQGQRPGWAERENLIPRPRIGAVLAEAGQVRAAATE
jgi:nucleoside-diphosphate-sugar epimerase